MRRIASIGAAGALLMSTLAVSGMASADSGQSSSGSRACSSGAAIYIRLDKFAPEAYYQAPAGFPILWKPYYWAVEGTNGSFRITRDSDDCYYVKSTANYEAENDSATNNADFTLPAGKTKSLEDPIHTTNPETGYYQDISFPVHADGQPEPVVERAFVKLSGYDNAFAGTHTRAPFYFIDNQTMGFAFAETSYSHSEFGPKMPVPVFRGGPATTSQTINFTVTGTGPNPAVEGENFEVESKSLTFAAGERVKVIDFSIINNRKPDGNRTFSISFTGPAQQSTTEITILDAGGDAPPKPYSRFHHPRQGLKYKRDDYRIREMHTFAFDNGGPEIEWAKFALRKKLRNGRCAFWNGKDFNWGNCSVKKWLQMKRFGDFNGRLLYIYEVKKRLKPTQGTRVEKYTAFTRVGNIAGAKEGLLEKGRNVSNFKVTR